MSRYTRLLPFTLGNGELEQAVSIQWRLDVRSIPVETIVLSWATLLRAFTDDESPVFVWNGKSVKANISSRSIEFVDLDVPCVVSDRATAISISDSVAPVDISDHYALSLVLSHTTGLGILRSTWGTDSIFLEQIGKQFKLLIQKQAESSDFGMASSPEAPEMSISNGSPSILPGPQLLHELALGSSKGPNSAIEFLTADGLIQELSYSSLDCLSTKLAFQITAALAPQQIYSLQDVIIPVLLPQSLDLYISYLGILKAGAAFCPMSVDIPFDRIQYIIRDVAATIVITNTELVEKLPKSESLTVITTDCIDTAVFSPALRWRSSCPSHLAYVMYTSGSEGRPKGVGVSHLAVTQSLLAHEDLIPRFQRCLQFASPTFDVSVFESFFPLVRNATVVACDRETMLRDISAVIKKMDVDAGELTPTVAGELLRTQAAAPSLRVLLTIGEMLTRHVVDEFGQSEVSRGLLHGMYGPTEAAIHCTAVPNFQARFRVNLIGQPFKTVSAFIASFSRGDEFRILPRGQIGELVIGGPQLADGYLNRPEENARAFIESPSFGRLYRTGDKARMLPTGDLECFGRVSAGQVKLRGQRIELGEIEHVVCTAANARSAVALITSGTLVAFLLADGPMPSDAKLRQDCQKWLPRFMIPGEFILVDKFPQLPSGKVDRKTLELEHIKSKKSERLGKKQIFRDTAEEFISSCVAEVLRSPADATESLGAAGLDSLAAIRLASRLRQMNLNFSVGELLEADSVEGIWRLTKTSNLSSTGKIKAIELEEIWESVATAGASRLQLIGLGSKVSQVEPCSPIQQSMIAETVRDSKAYCNFVELEFCSRFRIADIKKALSKLAHQNDILRSGFIEIGLKGFPYGRFVWDGLRDQIFEEREQFQYEVSLGDEHGILYPMRVQYREKAGKLNVLLHLHHAIYDGWSWDLIKMDLRAALTGNDLVQRPSYSSVTSFFIESGLSDSAAESYAYWQDQLYGISPTTWPNFNTSVDVPCSLGVTTRVLDFSLAKLNEASRQLRVSRQSIFQASLGCLLSSYFGASDIMFGIISSGRTLPIQNVESIIGPCIRALPMRLNLGKVQNVSDLILAAHNLNRRSLDHENVSLHSIKKASSIDLDLRLFDTAIVWQESIWADKQEDLLMKETAAADFLEFTLLLEFEPKDANVHVKATYQKSVLPLAQVEILLDQINHIASSFIGRPDILINDVYQGLPPSLLSICNSDYERQVDLPSLASAVEDIASTDPNRLAIEFLHALNIEDGLMDVEGVTYWQLNCRSNQLAHHLVHLGVQGNDFVAVLMEKSIELYVAALAIFKIGAAYIPITPQSPTQKVHSILTESGARICITDLAAEKTHALHSFGLLRLVRLRECSFQEYPDCNYLGVIGESAVAYVVFTSGSTGKPKGVLVQYSNMQSNIAVLADLYPNADGSKILQACSHGFDVSVFEILFAWHMGMTLCATTNDILFRDIQHVIRSMDITHLSLTPTVAALINPQEVPGVQFLVTAGEGLSEKVHQSWAGRGLYQGYGPCETTNVCTVSPNVEAWHPIRNIGPPLKNCSAFILLDHDDFRLAPRGAAGELCIGGDQVAKGYLNMPDLTAKKFILHPLYGKIYRSGDFVRFLPDGSICFIERRDDQVKLRGQRVELGEINNVLLGAEAVHDCASAVLEDPNKDSKRLVTFWVPSASIGDMSARDGKLTSGLFLRLQRALPSYMIPSHLIPVGAIPRTENGKADHRTLSQEFYGMSLDKLRLFSPEIGAADVERFSKLESAVAVILADVTGTELRNIHRNTSFYHVGLDSISAISFSRKLREAGLGQLDISAILRQSSVSQLSAVISGRISEQITERSSATALQDVLDENFIRRTEEEFTKAGMSVDAIYPCTPLQEAMLSVEESHTHSAYFNHVLFEVHMDIDRLRAAWCRVLERHAIFRTCFRPTNSAQFAYAQIVLQDISLPFRYLEISEHLLNTHVEKEKLYFQELFKANIGLPYSLSAIKDNTRRKNFLLFSIHHALYDGEAIGQVFREVQSIYSNQLLPDVVPFEHFIESMVSTDTSASDTYWDNYLSDVSPSLLAGPKGDRSVESSAGQYHIDLEISYSLFKEKCRGISVTPLSVFHAAWARLLSIYLDSSDVCFGSVASGRTIPLEGVERVIGPCFNTLPVRIKFTSAAMNEDIMKISRKNNSEMLPYQLSPLRRIQKRSLGDGSHLFDTLVILQAGHYDLDEGLWKLISEEGSMDFPFICEITPDDKQNRIRICLHAQESCISPSDGELMARQFCGLVEHSIRYPSAQASDTRPVGNRLPSLPRKTKSRQKGFVSLVPTPPQESRVWSHEERLVRDILCDFAKTDVESVSLNTTIFQLGLDSINAVQTAGRLRDLGYNVSVGSLLEAATIGNISALLSLATPIIEERSFDFSAFEAQHKDNICEQLKVPAESVESIRPCTPVQSGMLAIFSNSDNKAYFNRIVLAQSTPFDTRLLKEAWTRTMAKHEMLRTGFISLRDKKFPFAMVTYKVGVFDLPWFESASTALHLAPPLGAEDIFKNIHLPPWYLVSSDANLTASVQLSALHAIYDAQALFSILADVASAYRGVKLSEAISISSVLNPILTQSYAENNEAESFWRGLSNDVQPTKFPDLHPLRIEERKLLVSSKLCSKPRKSLEDGCRVIGATIQAAGQAAWSRLLSAYTAEKNVTFGVVLSGRNLSTAAQEAVFPCLVTVPSPCRVTGTNRELLEGILKRNASLVKYQFVPLSKVQRWLGADEGLFDTLFVYQKLSSQIETEDWKILDEDTRINYPVSIEIIPRSEELELRLTHRNDVVPAEQGVIILEQFDHLLQDCIFFADADSNDYSSLGIGLLAATPSKEERIPCEVSLLHQFVEHNAAIVPSKTAFEFAWEISEQNIKKKTWTYSELNDDGNRVARLLQNKGIIPGSMVAVCFDKCPEASLGILGVMKAGCAYVAIDPNAPAARKQFILDDSGSRLLLCTQSGKASMEPLSGVELITLDEPCLLDGLSSADPILPRSISPSDTCYCLYTSGTTGTPKGCEITHDNAVQAMLAFQRLFHGHWDSESRWLQFASFHFDVSVLEQYWSWSVGICVTSCPRDLLFEDLPGTIHRLQITHIDLTPSLARLVHPDEVPSLCRGVFITGGEQLKQEILDSWGEHNVIYNGYGPTEVTIGCTMLPRVQANGKPSNIGPQFDNVGSYVFAPGTSKLVPRGGVGELCVSGALVGRGYLNRAELTKERFQYLHEFRERIYRTGDLVRILHDGSFLFLGRIDDQIKLRGQRLEIGEINEVMRSATQELGEVATLVVKHPKQPREQLVSFVTRSSAEKRSPLAEIRFTQEDREFILEIKAVCHSKLPSYMVPTHIIPITLLPLSANNKADMKALKAMYQNLSLNEIQKLAPMSYERRRGNSEERQIIAVLSRFIESSESEIMPWMSIYELGLDSVSVISFSRHLQDAGFTQSNPSLIMRNPTVSGMASALQGSKRTTVSHTGLYENARRSIEAFAHKNLLSVINSLGITDNVIEMLAPCTPLQEGIIYHFLDSGRALYCSSFGFALFDHCDVSMLKRAWSETQKETQVLRMRLSPTPDGYAQVLLKDSQLPLFEISVSSEGDIENAQKLKFNEWVASLEDLTKDLWAVWIIHSPNKSMMYLNIFHALYDGISLPLLLGKVARKYFGKKQIFREPTYFDTLAVGPLCKDPLAEAFWKEHLQDAHYSFVPKSNSTAHPALTERVDIHHLEHVDKFRKSINITEQAVYHACWLLTLQQEFNLIPQLGIVVSGRALDIHGIENVIGPLFNTIPSNVNFCGVSTWSDLTQRCHNYHISALPFQHTPLRDIMKWMRRPPSEPLFNSLFVFRKPNDKHPSHTGRLWRVLDSEAEHNYPLAFEVVRNEDGSLTAAVAVQDYVMSLETAQRLLISFERHLTQFPQSVALELPRTSFDTNSEGTQVEAPTVAVQSNKCRDFEWTLQSTSIKDVIANIAGVEKKFINADTSIFELGLDSIDAIRLSSRLKKLGIYLPVSLIMRYRTIRDMTRQLDPATLERPDMPSLLVQLEERLTEFLKREEKLPKDACRVLPATPIQEAMVAEMVASGYRHYYSHDVLTLEPNVDLIRLIDAWKAVINANPILRTSFTDVWDPDIPVSYSQVVHYEGAQDIQRVELETESIDVIIEKLQKQIALESTQRPLLTLTLVLGRDKRYLILSIAHSLYDGWSMDMLHEDVAKCYAGEPIQRPLYDDILQHIMMSSGEDANKFWRTKLTSFTPAPFPKRKTVDDTGMTLHRQEKIFSQIPSNVHEFCKLHRVTAQALCVACWSLVLAGYIGKPDVVFGLVLSGRNTAGFEDIMFPTMNTVVMRAILHGSRMEMVKYVQDMLVDMSEHQYFPLRKVRPDIGPRQLFDTLFIYQKKRPKAPSDVPLLYRSTGGSSAIEFPVCVELESLADTMICRVASRDSVLGATGSMELLERIEHVLTSILQEPNHQAVEFDDRAMKISALLVPYRASVNGVSHDDAVTPIETQTEWTSIEVQIRKALSVVADTAEDEISKEATLFQLGLDSISAIKVSSLLKKQSIRLTVSDMLMAGTISRMALAANRRPVEAPSYDAHTALEAFMKDIDTSSVLKSCDIDSEQVERVLPVTAGQAYFLSMNALNPETFYPTFYYQANEKLKPDLLDDAWYRLVKAIPILRTAFARTNVDHSPFVQIVMKTTQSSVIWDRISLCQMAVEHPRRAIQSAPVALFASDAPGGTILVLQIHHALYDGISLPIIVKTLTELYNNSGLQPQANAQLTRYLAFQSIHSRLEVRRNFWQEYLGQHHNEDTFIFEDRYTDPVQNWYRPGLVSNMSKVEVIAKREDLSVQSIFLALYARIHTQAHRDIWPTSNHMVIGLYLANRTSDMDGLSDLIVPTVNIVPLRISDKHGDASLFTYARMIQDEINEISRIEHCGVSLTEISEWTGVQLDTCVNFLKLPGMMEVNGSQADSRPGLQILPFSIDYLQTQASRENSSYEMFPDNRPRGEPDPPEPNNTTIRDVVVHEACKPKAGEAVCDLSGFKEVFKPTLDVEAAIRDGRLDFGIFGPKSRLNNTLAEHIIEEMRLEMSKLAE